MLYSIDNPKGKDAAIKILQMNLAAKLGWTNSDIYARVYRVPAKNGGYVPQAYIGSNEYRDVYTNDQKNAVVFFIDDQQSKSTNGIQFVTKLKVVFTVDLNACYPDLGHRADTEAENDAINSCKGSTLFSISGVEKGIEKVFSGFNTEGLRLSDMHRWHVFAVVGELKYQENCF